MILLSSSSYHQRTTLLYSDKYKPILTGVRLTGMLVEKGDIYDRTMAPTR